MINENIATLTGTLKFKADYRTLITFEKRLTSVEAKLRAFSDLANKKFNIKVTLDGKALRAQLDKAMNAKITFKNFHVDLVALDLTKAKIAMVLDKTPIRLSNIKINISEVLAQRALLRTQLGSVSLGIRVGLNFKEAQANLRAWKAKTEQGFKLHLNADISQAKLYRNVARTMKAVAGRLGTVTIKSPMVKLSVDRQHLRAEIASVLAQIKREVKIKIDLNSRVSGNPRPSAARAAGNGFGGGYGLPYGALGGVGALAGLNQLNTVNQQQQGNRMALMSVTGSAEAGDAAKARLEAMGDEIGFNTLKMAPSFVKMIAAGKGTGFSQDQTEQIFKSMTEYGRVMGLSSEEMKGSLRAVEQMMNKGQIMSEELKGQLGERFPAAVSLMAKSMGKTTPELLAAMEKGQVSSKALLKFAELISQEARAGGALEASKSSTAAMQARAENGMNRGIEMFSKGGFDRASTDFFKRIAEAFERNKGSFASMGAAFEMITRPILAFISVSGKLLEIIPKIGAQFGMTGAQLMTLGAVGLVAITPFGQLAIVMGILALAIGDIIAFTEGKDSLFGRFLKADPAGMAAFTDLSTKATGLANTLDGIFLQLGNLGPALKELAFSDMLTNTMRELSTLIDGFYAIVDKLTDAGLFAKQASDGTIAGTITRTIQGLSQTPEENAAWLTRDAEAQRAQAQSELKTRPDQLDRAPGSRQSVGSADGTTGEDSPARRAMWNVAMQNPVTIDKIVVEIKGTGILTEDDMIGGFGTAMKKVAQDTLDASFREAAANQKELK